MTTEASDCPQYLSAYSKHAPAYAARALARRDFRKRRHRGRAFGQHERAARGERAAGQRVELAGDLAGKRVQAPARSRHCECIVERTPRQAFKEPTRIRMPGPL